METKSSLARILWSVSYLGFAVVGLRLATGAPPFSVSASPQQDRTVTRKPWRGEPVKVVGVKTKKKESIEIGKAFDDYDDWLDGFTVSVVNNSDKTITAMTIEITFRRESGDTRPPLAEELHFGPSPMSPQYIYRDPTKVIKPGDIAHISLTPENYNALKGLFESTGYQTGIRRLEIQIREVGFEDGSVFHTGTIWLQDPKHPNDPTKKIAPPKARLNHHLTLTR
jgi:hypothetical protein